MGLSLGAAFLLQGLRIGTILRVCKYVICYYHWIKSFCIWSYSGQHFPAFGLNMERYFVSLRIQSECGTERFFVSIRVQSKCGKMRTRMIPHRTHFTQCIFFSKLSKLSLMKDYALIKVLSRITLYLFLPSMTGIFVIFVKNVFLFEQSWKVIKLVGWSCVTKSSSSSFSPMSISFLF